MKVSGFTFIKNGLTLGYPILESIQSIDPLCDEVVINVGFNDPECTQDDGTYDFLTKNLIGERYKFIKSWWDPKIQKDGLILSQQTNIALDKCSFDICHYIQGDEVVHEADHSEIKRCMKLLHDSNSLEGIIFQYNHFYGSTDVVKRTRNIYRREVRVIKKSTGLRSHLDAQGFRHKDGSKPKSINSKARIFHYGWARKEDIMARKVKAFDRLYHGNKKDNQTAFTYGREWGLRPFKDTHPKVVENWIATNRNSKNPLDIPYKFSIKDLRLIISDFIEALTGWRMGEFKGFRES